MSLGEGSEPRSAASETAATLRPWPWFANVRRGLPKAEGDRAAAVRVLGIKPRELDGIVRSLVSAMPVGIVATPILTADKGGVRLKVKHPEYELDLLFVRQPGEFIVDFGLFKLQRQQTGAGWAAIRNALLVADQVGLTHVTAYANYEIGGYAWSRLGGIPYTNRP